MSLNQTRAQKIRGALLSIAQNESVFLFVAFVSYSFLSTDVLAWYVDSIAAFNRFVVLPWGGALCLLRLCRAQRESLSRMRISAFWCCFTRGSSCRSASVSA